VHNISERPVESEALAGKGVKETGKLGYRNKFWVGAENGERKHYCK